MDNPLRRLRERVDQAVQSEEEKKATPEQLVFRSQADSRAPSFAQVRYLPHLLDAKESMALFIALVVLVITLPILLVRGYVVNTEIAPDFGGDYTEGLVGAPQYINPALSSLNDVDADLSKLVYSGLFVNRDDSGLQSNLVSNHVVSDDQLTYTFYLWSDITWHDGEPFTADDVIFTINTIQDTQYGSPLEPSLRGVVAEKIDDTSFSLTLPEPFAPFLSTLTFGVLPQHLWFSLTPQSFRLTELNTAPIGTGPYKFKELTKDTDGRVKSLVLERHDEYFSERPFLDELRFIFYPDTISAVEALKSKKIEGLGFVPREQVEEVQDDRRDVLFTSLRVPQYTAVFFNQKQAEVLQNDAVRTALARSVDRDGIVSAALNGGGEPIYTPILPGYVGHNAEVERHTFDVAEAIRLLEEDGWEYPEVEETVEEVTDEEVEENESVEETTDDAAPDEATVDLDVPVAETFIPREKDGTKLEFTISTVDVPEYLATLAALQERWQEIGVKVNVDTYSPEDIQNAIIKKRDYEALLFGQIVGNDPDPYPFWHSSQQDHPGLGLAIFRDTEIDGLLEEARQTSDEEERRTRYLHFQNNLAAELPALFLYNPLYSYAVHEKVQGIDAQQYITVPSDRFDRVTEWYIETQRDWN